MLLLLKQRCVIYVIKATIFFMFFIKFHCLVATKILQIVQLILLQLILPLTK